MKLAERVALLRPSATLAISAKAQELRAGGKDILSLSIGEPDFPTPAHICEAAKKAIDEGFTRYTPVPGIPALREAVAGYFNDFYDAGARPENILISTGGKQAIYNLCQALLNPGDHVLIPAPYWVSYPPIVELAAAKPVVVPTSAAKSFKVDIAALEKSLTPKTRMLMLNSPANPTGVCYTREELDAIAEWAFAKDLVVFSDEIYDRLIYDGREAQGLCPWWRKHPDNFVIGNGVSKTFAMTGWRVGYMLGAADIIQAMGRVQGQSTSCVCSIAQKAALAALEGGFDETEKMRKAFERRRNTAMGIVNSWPDVVCPNPDGAFYIFIDVHKHYNSIFADSTSLCSYLLDKAGVALVPGAAFGDDRCIRLSYAVNDDTLVRALNRVGDVLFGGA